MANREGEKLKRKPASGEYGDACLFISKFVAAATPIADVVRFAELPAGCEVIDINLVNDALGASSTLSIGYEYVDSSVGAAAPAAFKAATTTASAGKLTTAFHPQMFNDNVYVTATVGGAAITGTVTVIISYRYVGTM